MVLFKFKYGFKRKYEGFHTSFTYCETIMVYGGFYYLQVIVSVPLDVSRLIMLVCAYTCMLL